METLIETLEDLQTQISKKLSWKNETLIVAVDQATEMLQAPFKEVSVHANTTANHQEAT